MKILDKKLAFLVLAAQPSFEDSFAKKHAATIPERAKTENPQGKKLLKTLGSPQKVAEHIGSHDPTSNGAYKQWLGKTYMNGGIRYAEDLPRAKSALDTFNRHKSKLEHKDINHYKSLTDLETAVKPHEPKQGEDKSWSEKGKELIANKKAIELHDDNNYHIVQPRTTEASKHFGINTKWCTAAKNDNQFDNYKKRGKLTYVLHKPTNKRYAFFEPKDKEGKPEFFHENDESLNGKTWATKHPKAAGVLHNNFHPLNSYTLGKKSDKITDNDFKTNTEKAIKSTSDLKRIDKLVNDPDEAVRQAVAEHGHKKHLDKLVNDPDVHVRESVAEHGNDSHRDKLVDDSDYRVRQAVAEHGNDSHRDKLVNDKNSYVRQAVAERGNKKHLDKLVDDKNSYVRQSVASHGHKEHLDKLVNDKSSEVRSLVAGKPHRDLLNKLINDKNVHIRIKANNTLQKLNRKKIKEKGK